MVLARRVRFCRAASRSSLGLAAATPRRRLVGGVVYTAGGHTGQVRSLQVTSRTTCAGASFTSGSPRATEHVQPSPGDSRGVTGGKTRAHKTRAEQQTAATRRHAPARSWRAPVPPLRRRADRKTADEQTDIRVDGADELLVRQTSRRTDGRRRRRG